MCQCTRPIEINQNEMRATIWIIFMMTVYKTYFLPRNNNNKYTSKIKKIQPYEFGTLAAGVLDVTNSHDDNYSSASSSRTLEQQSLNRRVSALFYSETFTRYCGIYISLLYT